MMIPVVGESFLFTQQQHDTQDSEVIIYLSIGQTVLCVLFLSGAARQKETGSMILDLIPSVASVLLVPGEKREELTTERADRSRGNGT